MINTTIGILESPAELSLFWLSAALGHDVTAYDVAAVGTGQMGSCHRITLTGDSPLPSTVLLKLPSDDSATRQMVAGAYRGEVRFYTELLSTVRIRTPQCLMATPVDDEGRFSLLLEDMDPAEQGDQVAGCTPEQARDAAVNLAGLHGPRWNDPSLNELGWITLSGPDDASLLASVHGPATETFLGQLGDAISADTRETLLACVEVSEAWSLQRQDQRFGIVHGDYRLDNLMFAPSGGEGPPVTAIDWQTLSLGLPVRDLSYLVGTGLASEDRRAHDHMIVESYHQALLTYGVTDYPFETCWDDYRFAMLQGPLVSVFGCAYGARTPRGDEMFAAMVERSCRAMRELDTFDLIG